MTADGSLRNGGVEFVTAGGLGGERLYAAFERITRMLETQVDYDASFRCSTHMHINMCDFMVPQVAKFLIAYAACEPVLFALCGNYRRSSNFCVPVADSLPFHKTLISTLYEDTIKTRASARLTQKYTAMNLQPLFGSDRVRAIGTVEFRGGRPMTTMTDFLLQANLLLSIKHFVRESGDSTAEEMMLSINDGVMNTIYANGVASTLNVPTDELEQAMVNAWMLCKAYQEGMSKPRKKKASPYAFEGLQEAVAAWSGPQRMVGPNVPEELQIFFDNSLATSPVPGTEFTGDDVPLPEISWPRAHRHIRDFSRLSTSNTSWIEYVRVMCQDRALGNAAIKSTDIDAAVISWQLRNAEPSFIPTMFRMVTNRMRGYRQGIRASRTRTFQPTLRVESDARLRFNWSSQLSLVSKAMIQTAIGSPVFDGYRTFQYLVESVVRVKNREALHQALSARYENVPNITEIMHAAHLKILLRMAQLPSANHVFRSDLHVYDRVDSIINTLASGSCGFPVFVSDNGNGVIRCTVRLNSLLYLDPRTAEAHDNSERRGSRTSPTTGRQVY